MYTLHPEPLFHLILDSGLGLVCIPQFEPKSRQSLAINTSKPSN